LRTEWLADLQPCSVEDDPPEFQSGMVSVVGLYSGVDVQMNGGESGSTKQFFCTSSAHHSKQVSQSTPQSHTQAEIELLLYYLKLFHFAPPTPTQQRVVFGGVSCPFPPSFPRNSTNLHPNRVYDAKRKNTQYPPMKAGFRFHPHGRRSPVRGVVHADAD
jgi:hypothetical protein